MEDHAGSRRSALRAIVAFVAGGAGLWRFLTPRSPPGGDGAGRTISLALEDIPLGGALVLPHAGVAVVREGSDLLALDLACTHLGCTVTATPGGFACPCHGSRFGTAGEVLSGPAPRPLRRIRLTAEEGVVRVPRGRDADSAGPCSAPGAGGRESS